MTTTIEAREPQTEGTHERDESEPVKDGLVLPPKWSPYAGSLATEVQLRVQALPEVTVTEIIVTSTQPRVAPQTTTTCRQPPDPTVGAFRGRSEA